MFRQESFFHWTFGISEPDFYGAIEVDTGHAVVFAPRLPSEYAVWLGPIHPASVFQEKYCVHHVRLLGGCLL